jgi:hypothetical protein
MENSMTNLDFSPDCKVRAQIVIDKDDLDFIKQDCLEYMLEIVANQCNDKDAMTLTIQGMWANVLNYIEQDFHKRKYDDVLIVDLDKYNLQLV